MNLCPRGSGKVAYKTKVAARRSARHARLKQTLEPYRCDCGWWHLTSKALKK